MNKHYEQELTAEQIKGMNDLNIPLGDDLVWALLDGDINDVIDPLICAENIDNDAPFTYKDKCYGYDIFDGKTYVLLGHNHTHDGKTPNFNTTWIGESDTLAWLKVHGEHLYTDTQIKAMRAEANMTAEEYKATKIAELENIKIQAVDIDAKLTALNALGSKSIKKDIDNALKVKEVPVKEVPVKEVLMQKI